MVSHVSLVNGIERVAKEIERLVGRKVSNRENQEELGDRERMEMVGGTRI